MKKIILSALSLALLATSFSISSCKKKSCWKCKTVFTNSNDKFWQVPGSTAAVVSYCDKTEAEIRQIEQEGTATKTYTQNGETVSSSTATTCRK
jgi:hypothetical protein